MKILAFDPGGTSGWAFLIDGVTKKIGEIKKVNWQDGLIELFNELEPDVAVCEDFINRPKWNKKHVNQQTWRKNEVPKQVGNVELICKMKGVRYVCQQPAIKPVGYGYAGLEYVKGKKGVHMQDAIAHGVYFYVKETGIVPKQNS